mmetsp:Transcript_46181/g.91020  ORF Transcript_46181/g.91020 Transcript_46181/m.91020 type:complete len:274 (-) Transcript_46181:1059-1880(-)
MYASGAGAMEGGGVLGADRERSAEATAVGEGFRKSFRMDDRRSIKSSALASSTSRTRTLSSAKVSLSCSTMEPPTVPWPSGVWLLALLASCTRKASSLWAGSSPHITTRKLFSPFLSLRFLRTVIPQDSPQLRMYSCSGRMSASSRTSREQDGLCERDPTARGGGEESRTKSVSTTTFSRRTGFAVFWGARYPAILTFTSVIHPLCVISCHDGAVERPGWESDAALETEAKASPALGRPRRILRNACLNLVTTSRLSLSLASSQPAVSKLGSM